MKEKEVIRKLKLLQVLKPDYTNPEDYYRRVQKHVRKALLAAYGVTEQDVAETMPPYDRN